MAEYEEWLEPQKEAEFVRNLPAAMLEFNTIQFSTNSTGLLQPDKSTETELVYLKASGHYIVKYTGKAVFNHLLIRICFRCSSRIMVKSSPINSNNGWLFKLDVEDKSVKFIFLFKFGCFDFVAFIITLGHGSFIIG